MPSAANSDERDVDGGARADRGDDRDAGRGAGDELRGFAVERRHQLPLGDVQQVAAVDDLGQMRCQARRGACASAALRRASR